MNAAEIIHQALTKQYGPHQGLNADWATCAWPIGNGRWLLDNEDGTYSVCEQVFHADGHTEAIEV